MASPSKKNHDFWDPTRPFRSQIGHSRSRKRWAASESLGPLVSQKMSWICPWPVGTLYICLASSDKTSGCPRNIEKLSDVTHSPPFTELIYKKWEMFHETMVSTCPSSKCWWKRFKNTFGIYNIIIYIYTSLYIYILHYIHIYIYTYNVNIYVYIWPPWYFSKVFVHQTAQSLFQSQRACEPNWPLNGLQIGDP